MKTSYSIRLDNVVSTYAVIRMIEEAEARKNIWRVMRDSMTARARFEARQNTAREMARENGYTNKSQYAHTPIDFAPFDNCAEIDTSDFCDKLTARVIDGYTIPTIERDNVKLWQLARTIAMKCAHTVLKYRIQYCGAYYDAPSDEAENNNDTIDPKLLSAMTKGEYLWELKQTLPRASYNHNYQNDEIGAKVAKAEAREAQKRAEIAREDCADNADILTENAKEDSLFARETFQAEVYTSNEADDLISEGICAFAYWINNNGDIDRKGNVVPLYKYVCNAIQRYIDRTAKKRAEIVKEATDEETNKEGDVVVARLAVDIHNANEARAEAVGAYATIRDMLSFRYGEEEARIMDALRDNGRNVLKTAREMNVSEKRIRVVLSHIIKYGAEVMKK